MSKDLSTKEDDDVEEEWKVCVGLTIIYERMKQ